MPYYKAKMHQIWFWLGLHSRRNWGSSQHFQTLWLDLRGLTSKEREGGKGWEREKGTDTGWRSGQLGNPSQLYQGPHLP